MPKMNLPSTKPYLVRALYDWCVDHQFTPFIAVAVDQRTVVPKEYVLDGKITLNISAAATNRLVIDNDGISFVARFGGVARDLSIPIARVTAIYARENGTGMAFEVEAEAEANTGAPETDSGVIPSSPQPPESGARPKLQRVK